MQFRSLLGLKKQVVFMNTTTTTSATNNNIPTIMVCVGPVGYGKSMSMLKLADIICNNDDKKRKFDIIDGDRPLLCCWVISF